MCLVVVRLLRRLLRCMLHPPKMIRGSTSSKYVSRCLPFVRLNLSCSRRCIYGDYWFAGALSCCRDRSGRIRTASPSGAFASCRGGVGVSGDPSLSHSLGGLEPCAHQLS